MNLTGTWGSRSSLQNKIKDKEKGSPNSIDRICENRKKREENYESLSA